MKVVLYVFVPLGLLLGVYWLGPKPGFESFDNNPVAFDHPLAELDQYLLARESAFTDLKPDNETRIVWRDGVKKAPCAIVYLHGFSASHAEGAPLHRNIAETFGCNLYLARLPAHGIDSDEAFRGIEPGSWVDEAKHAVALGKLLGERLIVMATSTGATLATYLAAADSDISALLLYSPNFELYDRSSHFVNGPWGKTIARLYFRDEYREWQASEEIKKYWSTRQHLDGLHALRHLVSATMNDEIFRRIQVPVFMAYYYRDEDNQDRYVSVPRMREFMQTISTPADQRRSYRTSNAGTHVIASSLWNENSLDLQRASVEFIEQVLALPRH